MDKIADKVKGALGKDQAPASTAAPAQPAAHNQQATSAASTTSTAGATGVETGRAEPTGQVGVPLPASNNDAKSASSSPAFDPAYITVVYVLGGPGAGKGTQCNRLVSDKDFVHLSAGDLLRAEQQREGSKTGQLIKDYITDGKIVPMEITIGLLQAAMQEAMDKEDKKRFLIDGFPRKLDQAFKFDETVCPGSAVLFLTCPEEILLERLLERGKTSGRDDDNAESIKKRFRTFIETSMPVVEHYRKEGKVIDINSSKSIDAVYAEISSAIDSLQRRKSMSLESR